MPVPREVILFVLLEKDRLCSSIFGFLKVAQTNTNKPIALLLRPRIRFWHREGRMSVTPIRWFRYIIT